MDNIEFLEVLKEAIQNYRKGIDKEKNFHRLSMWMYGMLDNLTESEFVDYTEGIVNQMYVLLQKQK